VLYFERQTIVISPRLKFREIMKPNELGVKCLLPFHAVAPHALSMKVEMLFELWNQTFEDFIALVLMDTCGVRVTVSCEQFSGGADLNHSQSSGRALHWWWWDSWRMREHRLSFFCLSLLAFPSRLSSTQLRNQPIWGQITLLHVQNYSVEFPDLTVKCEFKKRFSALRSKPCTFAHN